MLQFVVTFSAALQVGSVDELSIIAKPERPREAAAAAAIENRKFGLMIDAPYRAVRSIGGTSVCTTLPTGQCVHERKYEAFMLIIGNTDTCQLANNLLQIRDRNSFTLARETKN